MDPILISGVLSLAMLIVLVFAIIKIVALSKLVSKLSENISGTGMTAKDLADELGGSIDQAFKNYVPKPEQLASALTSAVETAGKAQLEQAEKLNEAFAESAGSVRDGLMSAGKSAAEPLHEANEALKSSAEAVSGGVDAAAQKLQAVIAGHAQEIQNALQGVGGTWRDEISGALSEHAQKLTEANNTLAAQLEKIAALEQDIEKVLHIQETVEGTIKEVAASEAFKATMDSLRIHLEQSDKLLREVAKPRTIRLVESDGEVAEA